MLRDEQTEYTFSDRERAFFASQIELINSTVAGMNNAARLVVAQQGLEGRWALKPDGSGLTLQITDARHNPENL